MVSVASFVLSRPNSPAPSSLLHDVSGGIETVAH